MKRCLRILLLLISVEVAIPFAAKDTGTIIGKIRDFKTGEGLWFADVILKQDGQCITGLTTGLDGTFVITGLSAGEYEIEALALGHSRRVYSLKIVHQKIVMLDVFLKKDESVLLTNPPSIGKISGIVKDKYTDEPLAYVDVTLLKEEYPIKYTETDMSGRFEFSGIATGECSIEIKFPGYKELTLDNIKVSEATILEDIYLKRINEDNIIFVVPYEEGRIFGQVSDTKTGKPLDSVRVSVINGITMEGGERKQIGIVITDEGGKYEFPNCPIASYTLSFSKEGYQNLTIGNLCIKSDTATELNVGLNAGSFRTQYIELN